MQLFHIVAEPRQSGLVRISRTRALQFQPPSGDTTIPALEEVNPSVKSGSLYFRHGATMNQVSRTSNVPRQPGLAPGHGSCCSFPRRYRKSAGKPGCNPVRSLLTISRRQRSVTRDRYVRDGTYAWCSWGRAWDAPAACSFLADDLFCAVANLPASRRTRVVYAPARATKVVASCLETSVEARSVDVGGYSFFGPKERQQSPCKSRRNVFECLETRDGHGQDSRGVIKQIAFQHGLFPPSDLTLRA